MKEARDASGTLTSQYFSGGEVLQGTSCFFTLDHLGSIRELTSSSGSISAQYAYDIYGRATKLQGTASADFQYAGYYFHAPSALNLTMHRFYNSTEGRWFNREPFESSENLFEYVRNRPAKFVDPSGLDEAMPAPWDIGGIKGWASGLVNNNFGRIPLDYPPDYIKCLKNNIQHTAGGAGLAGLGLPQRAVIGVGIGWELAELGVRYFGTYYLPVGTSWQRWSQGGLNEALSWDTPIDIGNDAYGGGLQGGLTPENVRNIVNRAMCDCSRLLRPGQTPPSSLSF